MRQKPGRQSHKRRSDAQRIVLSPPCDIEPEPKNYVERREGLRPSVSDALHHHRIHGEQRHQRWHKGPAWTDQRGHDETTRQKHQQIDKGENHLEDLETVTRLPQEKGSQFVHCGRPCGELVAEKNRSVTRKGMEEEYGSLKMSQPVAIPTCARIVSYAT